MKRHELNARLNCAAELVRAGAVFADIGTDHGYLPLFLLQTDRVPRAILTDINEGPLESARANVNEAGYADRVEFHLTDGAGALRDSGATDYAVCGMGGELIARIIDEAPHLKRESVNLILQPMTRQGVLRKYLWDNGFEIKRELYSTASGRHYLTLLASYVGTSLAYTEPMAFFGEERFICNSPSYLAYMRSSLKSLLRERDGKKMAEIDTAPLDLLINEAQKRITLAKEMTESDS